MDNWFSHWIIEQLESLTTPRGPKIATAAASSRLKINIKPFGGKRGRRGSIHPYNLTPNSHLHSSVFFLSKLFQQCCWSGPIQIFFSGSGSWSDLFYQSFNQSWYLLLTTSLFSMLKHIVEQLMGEKNMSWKSRDNEIKCSHVKEQHPDLQLAQVVNGSNQWVSDSLYESASQGSWRATVLILQNKILKFWQ